MLKHLILFLIRIKLGVKKYDKFQFANQRSDYDKYWFDDFGFQKTEFTNTTTGYCAVIRPANVSLMFLISDECEIKKVD